MTLPQIYRSIVPTLTLSAALLLLAACGGERGDAADAPVVMTTIAPTVAPTDAPTDAPTPLPAPVEPISAPVASEAISETVTEPITDTTVSEPAATEPAVAQPTLSFTSATYEDASAGFALDYPADWTVDPSSQVGVRGGQAALLSPGTTLEALAEGGTRLTLVTYVWDPKNDLDAYMAQRKIAWEASGFAIEREEPLTLSDGRAAYAVVIRTPEAPSFMLFTTVGEDYLQISGEGDLALVEEILSTFRPLE